MYCRCRLVFLHEQSEQDCIEDKEFYGQHLGRFCLDYYDEREILVRILYPVYLGKANMQTYSIFAFPGMEDLTVSAVLLLYVLGSLGMLLPVQGGIGPWHFAVIAGLSYYGITGNEAGAFAFVAHGSQMVLIVLIGIYAFISMACDKKKPKGERIMAEVMTELPKSDRP